LGEQYGLTQNLLIDVNDVGTRSLHQPGYWYYNAGQVPAVDNSCNMFRTIDDAVQNGRGIGDCLDSSGNSLRGPYFMRGDETFAMNFPITERQ
jgi:hypothetical protein